VGDPNLISSWGAQHYPLSKEQYTGAKSEKGQVAFPTLEATNIFLEKLCKTKQGLPF